MILGKLLHIHFLKPYEKIILPNYMNIRFTTKKI